MILGNQQVPGSFPSGHANHLTPQLKSSNLTKGGLVDSQFNKMNDVIKSNEDAVK